MKKLTVLLVVLLLASPSVLALAAGDTPPATPGFTLEQLLTAVVATVVGLGATFVVGGLTFGGAIAYVAGKILSSPVILSALEGAFKSLPADTQTAVISAHKVVEAVVDDVVTVPSGSAASSGQGL